MCVGVLAEEGVCDFALDRYSSYQSYLLSV